MGEIDFSNRIYFSTGSTLLDLAVGGGTAIGFGMGYEAGTIVRDWGGSSSTKTQKFCELLACNRRIFGEDHFKWVYDDVEMGNTFSRKMWGFDILPENRKDRVASQTVEEWEYNINKFIDSLEGDQAGVYVLDSLNSLSSDEIEKRREKRHKQYDAGKEFDEGTYGAAAAKFLSQEGMRGLASKLAKKNALLCVISQERDNMNAGPYGKKNLLTGGQAVKFHETCRIYSKYLTEDLKNGLPYASIIHVKAEKTRHPRPYAEIDIPVIHDYGIDDVGGNIDYLFNLRGDRGELLKRAEKIKWEGEVMDRDTLIDYIYANKLVKELRNKTIQEWEDRYAAIATKRPPKYEEE